MNQEGMKKILERDLYREERFSPLSHQEELDLISKMDGSPDDDAIRMELRDRNVLFAISAVAEISTDPKYFFDLISEAYLGLDVAARRFDPSRGNRFITYASWWIRSYCIDYVRRNCRALTFPANAWKDKALLHDTENRVASEKGDSPTTWEAFKLSSITKKRYDTVALLIYKDMPTSIPIGKNSDVSEYQGSLSASYTLGDSLADDGEDYEDVIESQDDDTMLEVKSILTERELEVLISSIGRDETMKSIGGRLGVSKQRVQQIRDVAMEKARRVVNRRIYGA